MVRLQFNITDEQNKHIIKEGKNLGIKKADYVKIVIDKDIKKNK